MFLFAVTRHLFDNECTLSASESLSFTQGEKDMEISYTGNCGSIQCVVEQQYGPKTRDEWKTMLTSKLKEKFEAINTVGKQSDEHKIFQPGLCC